MLHPLTSANGTEQKVLAAQQLRQQSSGTTDMLSWCPACLPLSMPLQIGDHQFPLKRPSSTGHGGLTHSTNEPA